MSPVTELEQDRVQEEFFERGWTDGLPVVPPTPDRVVQMCASVDLEPGDTVGSIPRRARSVTVEQAAINAVMAGCRPDYFPIVIAALGAVLDPAYNAHAALSSTGGSAVCIIVSGPLARDVGMNCSHNALGPGNRANATIGRALRLIARNVFGAVTGKFDATAMGNPAKYSLCFAEEEPPAPWRPLRERLGYDHDDTTVTVMATEAPRQVANHLSEDAEGVLRTFASAMRVAATYSTGKGGQGVVVMGPEHALAVRQAGWTQEQAQEFLCRESRVRPEELVDWGVPLEVGNQHNMVPGDDGKLPSVGSADDVCLVTAGGAGPGWSAYIPSFAPLQHTRAVTRRVRLLGEPMPDCGPDGCAVELPGLTAADR